MPVQCLPFRNKVLVMAVKNYIEADLNLKIYDIMNCLKRNLITHVA